MIHKGFLRFRIILIFFVGLIFFIIILARALQLQLLPNQRLAELSNRQYKKAITLYPKRGTIFDRNMKDLAVSRRVGSIFINPRRIKNKRDSAKKLSKLTGIPDAKLYKKMKSKKYFLWVKRLVDDAVTEKIKSHPMKGVGIIYEYKRFYTNEELAGQVLGMVGMDSKGIEGLEYRYNKTLEGTKKSLALIRDAFGRVVSVNQPLFMESQEGNSVVLTLDKSLQFLLEREVKWAVDNFKAKQGLAVIQNANTGEILALAHYPFFNPNRFNSYQKDPWKNRAVIDVFEPGSIFKTFLSALALEEGISPTEQFYCENGKFQVNKKDSIKEAENHKFKWLSFQDILKYSSNIGAAKMAVQLGKLPFHRKIFEFGFGSKSQIDLPGESAGIVRSQRSWEKIDLTNIAFGQGISVNAIQLVSAMSAIANGGKLMKPYIVKKIMKANDQSEIIHKSKVIRQVISPRVAKQLTQMLVRVTDRTGTGSLASLDGFKVAGKTGTAQKPNLKRGGYWKDKYASSFLGFFPADAPKGAPKYTILVLMDEPTKFHYASQVAAPLFKQAALSTLRVFPPNSKMAKIEEKKVTAVTKKVNAHLVPSELNVSQALIMSEQLMPDLSGRSLREVLQFASQAGILVQVKGSGIVTAQSIKAGKQIFEGQKCIVTFKAPSK